MHIYAAFTGHKLIFVFLGSPPDTSYVSDPEIQTEEDDAVSWHSEEILTF